MKKTIIDLRNFLVVSAFICFSCEIQAQSYTDSLAQDNHDILSSIAPYPEDVRSAILDVSQYPQALVKLERVQARSSQSFEDMISSYRREDQEKLYEISRFPDLISEATRNGKIGQAEMKSLLKDFPTESQTRILQIYSTNYDDVVKMHALYQSSQDALQKIMASYPSSVQSDFKKVVDMPEVINLLTENIDLTVSLGDEYKANPNGIRQQLDAMNTQLTGKNKEDLDAYKKEVEGDPKLQDEMKRAATDFSASYDHPDNPNYVANNYYDNYPYPYWFSYPYWYNTPMWYPRPMYYHTGFYYGVGGNMVIVGLPSRMYSGWFYGRGYRRYPYLYNHYNTYYSFHRNNVYRGFNNSVSNHMNYPNNSGRGREVNNSSGNLNSNQRATSNNAGNKNVRSSQMMVNPNHINNQGMQRFHANTYHSMGWQNVGGRGSGGGGVQRMGGSGGQHSGGGRGRH